MPQRYVTIASDHPAAEALRGLTLRDDARPGAMSELVATAREICKTAERYQDSMTFRASDDLLRRLELLLTNFPEPQSR